MALDNHRADSDSHAAAEIWESVMVIIDLLDPADVAGKSDVELNAAFRAYLRKFTSEPSIRMNAGIFRSMCEGYTKAFAYNALDKITMEQRKNTGEPLRSAIWARCTPPITASVCA